MVVVVVVEVVEVVIVVVWKIYFNINYTDATDVDTGASQKAVSAADLVVLWWWW